MRAILLALLVCASGTAAAHSWYDGACCNEGDCRQTVLGEVERHDDGWFVVSTGTLIPFNSPAIKHSQDALIHVCLRERWSIDPVVIGKASLPGKFPRCLYVPDAPT